MTPINFPGAQIIKSNGEENCNHIYAQRVVYQMPVLHSDDAGNLVEKIHDFIFWREMWMPSVEDIKNILVGRPIVIELHCAQLTPVGCYTYDENGNIIAPEFDNNLKPE